MAVGCIDRTTEPATKGDLVLTGMWPFRQTDSKSRLDNVYHWNMKLDVLCTRLEQDPVEVQQVVAQRLKRGVVNA